MEEEADDQSDDKSEQEAGGQSGYESDSEYDSDEELPVTTARRVVPMPEQVAAEVIKLPLAGRKRRVDSDVDGAPPRPRPNPVGEGGESWFEAGDDPFGPDEDWSGPVPSLHELRRRLDEV